MAVGRDQHQGHTFKALIQFHCCRGGGNAVHTLEALRILRSVLSKRQIRKRKNLGLVYLSAPLTVAGPGVHNHEEIHHSSKWNPPALPIFHCSSILQLAAVKPATLLACADAHRGSAAGMIQGHIY